MLSEKVKLFMEVRLRCFLECRQALLRCIRSALTSDVVFLSARVRNGLNARAMVRSTTASVKKRVGQLHAEWIVSEWALRTVFSQLTLAQYSQGRQLVSTPLDKKLKDHTVSAEGTNHVCIN
jgi:hypothetical protein